MNDKTAADKLDGKKVYGIDLGTTYSCVAHVDEHGKPVILPNSEGDLTTPSVVYFEDEDSIAVGKAAKEVAAVEPDSVVSTVKRMMGVDWDFEAFGKVYKPQDVSSFILRKVVEDAENVLGEKIENVVITCPAYFGVNEKEATKQAGELAGLNVMYVIPEPTAAALSYGIEQTENQTVLVYDLGGGTFDVTVIDIQDDKIEVVCTGGDHQLGGKNWDDAVVKYFAASFEEETGIASEELLSDVEIYQELLSGAEEAKKTLSSRQSTARPIRFGGKRVKVELTREKFEEITAQHLAMTLSLTEKEIEKAKAKGYSKIDKLLLVGGSTYMPQVMDAVKGKFEIEVLQFDPNQAVAKGAAIFGFKMYLEEGMKKDIAERTGKKLEEIDLSVDSPEVEAAQKNAALEHGLSLPAVKKITKPKVVNVASKSFGLVVVDPTRDKEVVANLVVKDSKVPVTIQKQFGTHAEGQTSAELCCMENQLGDEQLLEIEDCKKLGSSELKFDRPLPAGSPVEVTFRLGEDGCLVVHGKDLGSDREIKTTYRTDAVMEIEELEKAKSRNLSIAVS